MRNIERSLVWVVVLVVLAMLVAQSRSLRGLRSEIGMLDTRMAEIETASLDSARTTDRPRRDISAAGDLASLHRRVAELENAIGHVAVTNNVPDLADKVGDAMAMDADRLQALRLLRRSKGLTEEVVQNAIAWFQASKDPDMRRDIMQQIDGATNAVARQFLMGLLTTDPDPKMRQEAVENLRHFTGDPEVEGKLWELAQNDPDPKIREQAEKALRDGPVTPERIARLQQQISNPQVGVDAKITAFRALREGNADLSAPATALVQLAQTTEDAATRAKIYQALDGIDDPKMMQPLVTGLQDPDPNVRRRAADALSGFASEPSIRKWLEYVAASDGDNRVRREAQQALKAGN
jgi:HEAT repeat protein